MKQGLKNYRITFGQGPEIVRLYETRCTCFAECACRLEYTGWEIEAITKIESETYVEGQEPFADRS